MKKSEHRERERERVGLIVIYTSFYTVKVESGTFEPQVLLRFLKHLISAIRRIAGEWLLVSEEKDRLVLLRKRAFAGMVTGIYDIVKNNPEWHDDAEEEYISVLKAIIRAYGDFGHPSEKLDDALKRIIIDFRDPEICKEVIRVGAAHGKVGLIKDIDSFSDIDNFFAGGPMEYVGNSAVAYAMLGRGLGDENKTRFIDEYSRALEERLESVENNVTNEDKAKIYRGFLRGYSILGEEDKVEEFLELIEELEEINEVLNFADLIDIAKETLDRTLMTYVIGKVEGSQRCDWHYDYGLILRGMIIDALAGWDADWAREMISEYAGYCYAAESGESVDTYSVSQFYKYLIGVYGKISNANDLNDIYDKIKRGDLSNIIADPKDSGELALLCSNLVEAYGNAGNRDGVMAMFEYAKDLHSDMIKNEKKKSEPEHGIGRLFRTIAETLATFKAEDVLHSLYNYVTDNVENKEEQVKAFVGLTKAYTRLGLVEQIESVKEFAKSLPSDSLEKADILGLIEEYNIYQYISGLDLGSSVAAPAS